MSLSLKNETVVVLGGTSGIGLAASEMLRDAGAEVIAGSRRECSIEGVECVQIDVLDRAALAALFEKHHGFDFLVNAATGGPRAIAHTAEGAEDERGAAERDLRAIGVGPNDAVVGIAASGATRYASEALAFARTVGAVTIGVSVGVGSLSNDSSSSSKDMIQL